MEFKYLCYFLLEVGLDKEDGLLCDLCKRTDRRLSIIGHENGKEGQRDLSSVSLKTSTFFSIHNAGA